MTGYDEAKAVLADAAGFSNAFLNIAGTSEEQDPGGLGMTDPPYHTRMRKMLTPEFTMRRLQRLLPRIDEIVTGLLDDMENAGPPSDLVEHFAMPIPSLVICELLGVPYEDREGFQALSTARFDLGLEQSPLDTIGTSLDYLQGLVEKERAHPGDGPARDAGPRARRRDHATASSPASPTACSPAGTRRPPARCPSARWR